MPKVGTGATADHSFEEREARGDTGTAADEGTQEAREEVFKKVDDILMGRGGETMVMENALKHIVTRITDEGLVIELFELDDALLFEDRTDVPMQLLRDLTLVITEATKSVTNNIAIGGHVSSNPIVLINSPVWDLSTERASAMRVLLQGAGVAATRIKRVTGHADRDPVLPNTMARRC